MQRKSLFVVLMAVVLFGGLVATAAADEYVPGEPIKAGFIYIGPVGDYGWSHAHDVARQILVDEFPWLTTVYVESVGTGDVVSTVDKLVRDNHCNVIFTTSFDFMDPTVAAAEKYPDVIFAHCSGFRRAPNLATYMADFYQVYYLNGLAAGALTKTNKVGYVGAVPIPEVKRHINGFTIGVREVNPQAVVDVRWINEWLNPAAAKEAAEALIAEGCDVFAFTEDSPTVVQVAAENGLASFAHYSPMHRFAPDYVVSGELVHWEEIYADFLQKVYNGVYTAHNLQNVDYWWLLSQGAVEMGAKAEVAINPAYSDKLKAVVIEHPTLGEINAYELIESRLNQMANPGITFDPFQGPVYNRNGNLEVPEGMWLSVDSLISLEWAAEGVVGPWPGEPE
ncbi:MAG: BMP family ABC transporter substrate-binding protein [Candidatus Bipolaricaulota bacterium]|nr:BMP family ABC transporter substrate-binding protein [Candidatus Bipolaricaulota bacterium]